MLPPHIRITENPGKDLKGFISEKKYSKVSVLMDEQTLKHCYPSIKDHLPDHKRILVKSGEEYKTIQTCTEIWQSMTEQQLDRHSALIVVGGGVLSDMGGFCASTFKRGIDFILVPTTLLAQADASIGGKLGIDFTHFKNQIGLFQEPALNLIHSGFLKTLPLAELRSGFAEVIKHALVSSVSAWKEIRKKSLAEQNWNNLLLHSTEFKYSVISKDPREKGLRKILNAGHTIGHALESYFLSTGRKILHGEAVAAGLICEAHLAKTLKRLSQSELDEISEFIISVFGKIEIFDKNLKEIAELCLQDKKNKGNKILAVLLDGIGRARWDCEISLDEIVDSLTFYRLLQM